MWCSTTRGIRIAEGCQQTAPLPGLQRAMAAASPLETGQAGKKVWLVKVPTLVAKQWRAAAAQSVAGGDAPELGRIRFSHDATQVGRRSCLSSRYANLLISESHINFHAWSTQRPEMAVLWVAIRVATWTVIKLRNVLSDCLTRRQHVTPRIIELRTVGPQNTSQFELQLPGHGGEAPRDFNMRVQTEDMQGMHSFAENRERGGISEHPPPPPLASSSKLHPEPLTLLTRIRAQHATSLGRAQMSGTTTVLIDLCVCHRRDRGRRAAVRRRGQARPGAGGLRVSTIIAACVKLDYANQCFL